MNTPLLPQLSLVIPTYNERENIRPLVAAVGRALHSIAWEMIVVDDDSPDRTFDEVRDVAREEPRVRCLRRIGRRGLSSAVIEGALAANADVVAVMDADFQHDESILPKMFALMQSEAADIVVGSRYTEGGSVGDWGKERQRMSDMATRISQLLVKSQTTDPMSGFFMVRQNVIARSVYDYSQQGYKVLLDILSSAVQPLRVRDVPYVFRNRRQGESKISLMVLAEFAFLLIEKLSYGTIPPRFVLFAAVGGLGVLVHLSILNAMGTIGAPFLSAQIAGIGGAMLFNFTLNNEFTYRDRRLRGIRLVTGLLLFVMVCSVGAIANIGVAELAIQQTRSWNFAGILGALMGAVFNFGAASNLVWGRPRRAVVEVSDKPAK